MQLQLQLHVSSWENLKSNIQRKKKSQNDTPGFHLKDNLKVGGIK